jgi:hypothetical protein
MAAKPEGSAAPVDTLLEGIETSAGYTGRFSDGGYTTNVPLEDLTGRKA